MSTAFHVNGTCEIKTGTGSAAALELLGHTIDGVDIDPRIMKVPVYTDAGGGSGQVPATHISNGEIHIVTAQVIVYDAAVLAKILRTAGGGSTAGVMAAAGTLLQSPTAAAAASPPGTDGYYRVLLTSPIEAVPYNYLAAHLIGKPVRLSTKPLVYSLTWECIPYIGTANTMASVVLYNTITSG